MSRRVRTTAALTASALLLASCGGHDGTSGPSTEPIAPATATPAETTAPVNEARLSLMVDTDLAADDLVALAYLLSDPTVDVLSVTVAGTGEVTCPRGADIARGLLARFDRFQVPVACGQAAPLSGDRVFPDDWRVAADEVYGLLLPIVEPPANDQNAVELLSETISDASTPVTLLALGPLTNIAQAFAAEPELAGKLAGIVIMGGAVDMPGNVQPEGADAPLAAEWNFYIDPTAAAAVLTSGAPTTLVALDATNGVPVTIEFIDRLSANNTTDATSFVADLLTVKVPPYLWDPLAAIAVARPELVPRRTRNIAVLTTGDDAGRTVEQPGASAVFVAAAPAVAAVLDHLLRALAALGEGEPLATPTTVAAVGEASVSFDGTVCAYDGPTNVPVGPLLVTVTPGSVPFIVLAGHLVEGATLDEVFAWQLEHPGEQPPMIDSYTAIGEGAVPSPASVPMSVGQNPVVCALPDGSAVIGAIVTAGDG